MIFKPNKYGCYLTTTDQADILTEEAIDMVSDLENKNPKHTGGYKELKEKIEAAVNAVKLKAAKAAGLGDNITIESCLKRLEDLVIEISRAIRNGAKKYSPSIRRMLDNLSNAVLDAIDYIKQEFS